MSSRVSFRSVLTVTEIGVEYIVADFPDMDRDYVLMGLIDASQMDEGDAIELSLYVAVDGVNRRCVYRNVYSNTSQEKVIYIRPFVSPKDGKARITLKQVSGTPKSFPYWIVGYVLYDEVASWILKLLARDIP